MGTVLKKCWRTLAQASANDSRSPKVDVPAKRSGKPTGDSQKLPSIKPVMFDVRWSEVRPSVEK